MIGLEDIMTKDIVAVHKDADIYDAIRMMVDGNITGVPVVDDKGYLEGVITEKDALKCLRTGEGADTKVSDYMTAEVVGFDVRDSLTDIVQVLEEANFRRVPILSKGKVVGIISRRDVLSFLFMLELEERGTHTTAVGGKFPAQ